MPVKVCDRCTNLQRPPPVRDRQPPQRPVDGSDARPDRAGFVACRNGDNYLLVSHTDLTVGSRSQNRNRRHVLMKFVAVDFLASSVT